MTEGQASHLLVDMVTTTCTFTFPGGDVVVAVQECDYPEGDSRVKWRGQVKRFPSRLRPSRYHGLTFVYFCEQIAAQTGASLRVQQDGSFPADYI